MSTPPDFLAERAFELFNAGKFAEATAPLAAAARLGGGERARRIADRLAWDLGAKALEALAAQRVEEAIEWASLGLTMAENVKCLYACCVIFAGKDPSAVARCARRAEDLAARADGDLRAAALTLLRDALLQLGCEEAERESEIEVLRARAAQLLAEHPQLEAAKRLQGDLAQLQGRGVEPVRAPRPDQRMTTRRALAHRRAADFNLAQGHLLLTVAHLAALRSLADAEAATEDEGRFRALSEALVASFEARRSGGNALGDEGEANVLLALLVGVVPDLGALAALMAGLWERNDAAGLAQAAAVARYVPAADLPELATVAYHCCLADQLGFLPDREAVEAQACEAFVQVTDSLLGRNPGLDGLRFGRTSLLIVHRRYAKALDDLYFLVERMQSDKALEERYAFSILCHVMYLLQYRNFPGVARLVEASLADPRVDAPFLEDLYMFCARSGLTEQAYRVAARLAKSRPHWSLLAYLERLVTDLDQPPAAMIERARTGRKVIYANTVCWGAAFVEKMAWGCLTSLAAPRNMPYLAETCDVVFEIVTLRENVEEIMALPEIRHLAQYCEIRLYCFPAMPDFKSWAGQLPYVTFGHGQHLTLLRARRDGADVLLLATDVVMANGSLAFIADHVSDEPRAIFSDGLNCAETPVRAALAAYRSGGALCVEPRDLAEIAVRWLKPITYSSFFRTTEDTTKSFVSSVTFRKPFGFRTYAFTQNLVYASAAALRGLSGFDHLTCEGRLSELALESLAPEQIVARRSTDDFLWIELDDADRSWLVPQRPAGQSLTSAIVANFMGYTRCLRRLTLFERPYDCHVEGLDHGEIIDDALEAQFLSGLRDVMASDPVLTELCVK